MGNFGRDQVAVATQFQDSLAGRCVAWTPSSDFRRVLVIGIWARSGWSIVVQASLHWFSFVAEREASMFPSFRQVNIVLHIDCLAHRLSYSLPSSIITLLLGSQLVKLPSWSVYWSMQNHRVDLIRFPTIQWKTERHDMRRWIKSH